ncbi:MAG: hypothetical protein ACC645_08755 [Pirellulales bacterium]
MNRATWALTTDFWRSRLLPLAGISLAMALFPTVVYGPLYGIGTSGWQDAASHGNATLHVAFTGCLGVCFVGYPLVWLPTVRREYTLPLSTGRLVVARSINGALATAAGYGLVCLAMNTVFQARWPFWGPVLFLVTVYLVAQAIAWLTTKAPTIGLPAFALLFVVSAWWFSCRYESGELSSFAPFGGQRMRMWADVTRGELFTMMLVAGSGLWGSYRAACLQRIDNGPTWSSLREAVCGPRRMPRTTTLLRFSSFQEALSWREWRERGQFVPIIFGLATLSYGCLWLLPPIDVRVGVAMGGGFSIMGTMSFLLFGIYLGQRSEQQSFPSFAATHPITDVQWSQVLIRNMARSTLSACGVWGLGIGLIGLVAWSVGARQLIPELRSGLPGNINGRGMAALAGLWLVACWTLSANGMMFALLRRWATIVLLPGNMAFAVFATVVIELFVPGRLPRQVATLGLWGIYFAVLLVATFSVFVTAWGRKLIGGQTCALCLIGWCALTFGCFHLALGLAVPSNDAPQASLLAIGLIIGSLATLPFLPLAATPLAVAWNRHR